MIQKHCLDIKNCESSKTGDLICKAGKIECKCFTSLGPTSFGHTEKWKYLFVLDGIDIINKRQLKVYRINLDNNKFSKIVMVNKRETMKKQCNGNKRPRIAWKSLYPQIKNNTVKVYDGSIEDIFKSE